MKVKQKKKDGKNFHLFKYFVFRQNGFPIWKNTLS